ncbi:MAG: Rrf2 family transcriptional regulator [Candidatus Riflemargulisbacteria bacterium]
MRILNRDTDLATRALCYLAQQQDKPISVAHLEDVLIAPRPFLRKILQVLQTQGFLKSFKGKKGGFILNKTADTIYIKDLIVAFHGPINTNECVFNKKTCPDIGSCLLKGKIERIKSYVSNELKSVTIASLIPQSKGE